MQHFILHHYRFFTVLILIVCGFIWLVQDMKDDSNWIDENDNPIPKEIIKHRREVEKTDKRLSKIYH